MADFCDLPNNPAIRLSAIGREPLDIPALTVSTTNSATSRVAAAGHVHWEDGGTHDIRKIGWRTGTVVTGSNGTFRVSLQDITTGLKPDNTFDENVTMLTSALASNTWYNHTLTADRTSVAEGAALSVVWDYSSWATSSSVQISSVSLLNAHSNCFMLTSSNSGTSWSTTSNIPIIVFEAADGALGILYGALPIKAINSHAFNNTSDPKEYAIEFTPEVDLTVIGMSPMVSAGGSTRDFDIVLYEGTTAVVTVSQSAALMYVSNPARFVDRLFSPTTVTAGNTCRAAVKPTTSSNNTVYSVDVDNANYFKLMPMGTAWNYATKAASGTWNAATTTRRLWFDLILSGSGGGGAGGVFPPRVRRHGV